MSREESALEAAKPRDTTDALPLADCHLVVLARRRRARVAATDTAVRRVGEAETVLLGS